MTNILTLVLVAVMPIVFLLYLVLRQDFLKGEPKHLLFRIFWLGVLVTIPIGLLGWYVDAFAMKHMGLEGIVGIFFTAFITAGLFEEAGKYFIVKRYAFPKPAFDEHIDGVIYGAVASLGFALLENILYVFQEGVEVGILRSVMAVPAHALFGGWMGYYLGKAKFASGKERIRGLWKALFYPVVFHGTYDFLLFTQSIAAILVFPLLFCLGAFLHYHLKELFCGQGVLAACPPKMTVRRLLRMFWSMVFFLCFLLLFIGFTLLLMEGSEEEFLWTFFVCSLGSLFLSGILYKRGIE